MMEVLESSIGPQRLTVLILSFFAVVAVVIAAVGICGVISYSVTQRTQELGVRLALGAKRGDLLRLVLRQRLGLAVVGVAIGMSGAFILTRVLSRLLFQVSATDPATFLGITVLFMLVTLAASYIPARRAMGLIQSPRFGSRLHSAPGLLVQSASNPPHARSNWNRLSQQTIHV